jgi:outer membrane protein assembly factor BamB
VPGERDPIHANSIEVFERSGRRFALVSLRNLDTIAVVDLEATEVVWAGVGPWHRQHEARFVPGGILLFDNLGLGDQSRVIEYDTERTRIVWSFTEPGFFSESEGAEQRLVNGNTLVTESNSGRLVEVTRDGRIVWEYVNPVSVEVDGAEVVLGISRAERLPPDFPIDWAAGGSHELAAFGR